MNQIHTNVESSVNTAQGMQKANHDKKAKETKYVIGHNVIAKNFRNGPKWLPGVIVEQLGTLTFLVQLDNGMFWKCHVDQLHCLDDKPRDVTVSESTPQVTSSEVFYSPDTHEKTVSSEENASPEVVSETPVTNPSQTDTSTPARRYPARERRPPIRYQS